MSDEELEVKRAPIRKKAAPKKHADPEAAGEPDSAPAPAAAPAAAPAGSPTSASEGGSWASTLLSPAEWDAMEPKGFVRYLATVSKSAVLEAIQQKLAEGDTSKNQAEAETVDWSILPTLTREFTYHELLVRAMGLIQSNNPELMHGGGKIALPMPRLQKDGSKKTALTNFNDICSALNRPLEEVMAFMKNDLGTNCSIDGNQCCIIKGTNIKINQIEALLRRYIDSYVKCNMCKSIDTILTRDTSSRLLSLTCNQCRASRNVQTNSTTGYTASTAKRARVRAKCL
jgi:translation initiation factor 2 subunit 2